MATNKEEKKEETRERNWFIEVNPKASCYNDFENIVKEQPYKHFAYIVHDKDIDENGSPKLNHFHLVLELKNATTFDSIKKKFMGAHIEVAKYKKRCYQYLIHKNDKDKTPYETDTIITDSKDYLQTMLEQSQFDYFDESKLIEYIVDGVNSYYKFIKRFGLTQANKVWRGYSLLLEQINIDEELQEDIQQEENRRLDDGTLPF